MHITRQTDLLDANVIRQGITSGVLARLGHLTLLPEADSTNTVLLNMPADRQHGHAVLAERQTGGRGRRNKYWHSPAGGNIYLSLGWRFNNCDYPLSTLPLVVAVAVCRALSRAGLKGHGIKWPNDILVDGKKLAGILVELKSPGSGLVSALAIVGVGLNVRMPQTGENEASNVMIDRPWTDLASELEPGTGLANRNRLVALLLEELLNALNNFELNGFPAFITAWQELDLLQGEAIVLQHGDEKISGCAKGVDENGGLLLQTGSPDIRVFHSGEVSVHYD